MVNPFAKFFSSAKLGLFQENSSVLGVDIGSSAIKVVQLRSDHGKAVLETYGSLAIGPYSGLEVGQASSLGADKLAEALVDILREANVTAASSAALSIPMQSSLLSVISLPKFDEKQLEKVVPLEARKYIPVPISEVSLDWSVIPERLHSDQPLDGDMPFEDKKLHILVAAIHNNILNKYKDLITRASVTSKFFEIETFSAIRAVLGRNDMLPTAILDIGAASSKVAIVDYGFVRVSHTISRGSQDISISMQQSMNINFRRAEEIKRTQGLGFFREGNRQVLGTVSSILEYIFFEADRVVKNYQQQNGRSVARLILIGSGSLLKGVTEVAEEIFDLEVELGDPFSKVQYPAFLAPVLKEAGPEFAVAMGLTLRLLQEV